MNKLTRDQQARILADVLASNGEQPLADLNRYQPEDFDQGWPRMAFMLARDGHAGRDEILPTLPLSAIAEIFPLEVEGATGPVVTYDVPPLPDEARLTPELGLGAGAWIDCYVEYATALSPMTPRHFHESAALFLAAMAIARRLRLPMAYGDVYPNLYILWLARTTLYRKTTALNIARNLALEILPHLLAAQDVTPEAFLCDLSGTEPANLSDLEPTMATQWRQGRNYAAQKGWMLDELSGLLAASGRDYNRGLLESILRLYECDRQFVRSTRGLGHIIIRNAYLSLLGASTPAALAPYLKDGLLWTNGFWPRFAILTPQDEQPPWARPQNTDRPRRLPMALRHLHERLPHATYPELPSALTVHLGADVHDAWDRYNKALSYDLLTLPEREQHLDGTYGRLPTQALKVATILAALDWSPKAPQPTIELPHLARALTIAEDWRASAHRALDLAYQLEANALRDRVYRKIAQAGPGGITLRDLRNALRKTDLSEIERALEELERVGEVQRVRWQPQRPGRPTEHYVLSED